MATRWWRPETTLFLGLWFLLMGLGRDKFFGDPGALWHIVVGERMLTTGELIRTDPFSFTHADEPWLAQWWIAEIVLAGLHRFGGLDAVLLALVTMVAALYTWVAHRAIRIGIHPLIATLIASMALLSSSFHIHPRPHLVTIILIGWTFARLSDFEAGRTSLRGLLWLVPVFVLWTNIHGGMIGGVAMVFVAALGWGAARWMGWETPLTDRRKAVGLALIGLGCVLAPLVNPFGLELPQVWFGLMSSPVLPRTIQEHAPLLACGTTAWVVVGFALFYLAALLGTLPGWPRLTWLLPLLWLGLTWTRIRYGPLFAITGALAVADMFPHIRWVKWLAEHGSTTCRLRPMAPVPMGAGRWKPALVPAFFIVIVALVQRTNLPIPIVGRGWARLDASHLPTEFLPELRAYEASQPRGTPIFNDMLFGGFLIYFTPDLRIFIDDRCELYGDKGLEEYAEAFRHHPERIESWADRYGLNLALVLPDQGFDLYLRTAPGWREVGRTQAAALYWRTSHQEVKGPVSENGNEE